MSTSDEAISALDVKTQGQVIDLLRRLSAERGLALLFITHNLSLLPTLVERVIVMHDGRIVESGAVDDVIKRPRSEWTRELLTAEIFSTEAN